MRGKMSWKWTDAVRAERVGPRGGGRERELQAVSGSCVDVSVNSASGVIARKLSNELKDLAAMAKTQ